MIPVLLGVSFIVFSIMYFTPGDPAEMVLGEMATQEDKEMFREKYGLNGSFLTRYGTYLKNIVTKGDFGYSYVTKRPVTTEILDRFPTTLKLAFLSVAIAVVIGVTLGIISAVKQYSIIDNICTSLAMFGVSMPSFWEAMMVIILFSVVLGWFPASGISTPSSWVLPAAVIGTESAATIMRMTRSSMLEVIRQDYITTARAKGQTAFKVITKHALKNGVIPVITVAGLQFGRLLGGTVIIETVFAIPGLGKLLIDAIKVNNYPMVQASALFMALTISIINLIVDILYAYVDPRIRSQYVRRGVPKNLRIKGASKSV